jgi:hypothetical protein
VYIRPVDMQAVLQKTSELQKTVSISREQHNQARHQFASELQQVSTREQQTVRQSDETEKDGWQQEHGPNDHAGQGRSGKKRAQAKTDVLAKDETRGAHLDIKA